VLKYIVGFILFAGLALWLLNRGGDIDMGGEKHEIPASSAPSSSPPPAPAPKK
jgi:hypothetical protein